MGRLRLTLTTGRTTPKVGITTMVAEIYDCLKETGASEEKARRVAEVFANDDRDFAEIRSNLKRLKWVQGATFAGIVALLLCVFLH